MHLRICASAIRGPIEKSIIAQDRQQTSASTSLIPPTITGKISSSVSPRSCAKRAWSECCPSVLFQVAHIWAVNCIFAALCTSATVLFPTTSLTLR